MTVILMSRTGESQTVRSSRLNRFVLRSPLLMPRLTGTLHPRPNTVITLLGTLEFTVHGGETFIVRPGEVIVAVDTTGSGHKWRLLDDQPWRRIYVTFANDAQTAFVSLD